MTLDRHELVHKLYQACTDLADSLRAESGQHAEAMQAQGELMLRLAVVDICFARWNVVRTAATVSHPSQATPVDSPPYQVRPSLVLAYETFCTLGDGFNMLASLETLALLARMR